MPELELPPFPEELSYETAIQYLKQLADLNGIPRYLLRLHRLEKQDFSPESFRAFLMDGYRFYDEVPEQETQDA